MGIRDFIYHANTESRWIARRACARKWLVGFCVVTTSASLGVVIGVLIASKSRERMRTDLEEGATKLVNTIEKVVLEINDDK